MLRVINGTVDAYVHTTRINKWDVCAGNAILNAVGGKMTMLSGQTLDYSKADSPSNSDGLLATLSEHSRFLDVFGAAFRRQKS